MEKFKNKKCEICIYKNICSQNINGKKGELISWCAIADEIKKREGGGVELKNIKSD